jgi:hypothetical protein
MDKNLFRKNLIIVIIALFVIASFLPSIESLSITNESLNNSPNSRGNWIYVGGSGPGNYTSIQNAINQANNGDNIYVYDDSSPYYENLYIDKSISLIGENKDSTIIDGDGT